MLSADRLSSSTQRNHFEFFVLRQQISCPVKDEAVKKVCVTFRCEHSQTSAHTVLWAPQYCLTYIFQNSKPSNYTNHPTQIILVMLSSGILSLFAESVVIAKK